MPISIRSLYSQICDCVLEPSALSGDTITDEQFLSAVNQVVNQFLELGPYVKPLVSETLMGVRIYASPGPTTVIKNLAVDEVGIPMNSGFYWDQSDAYWQNRPTGNPKEWRQDQLEEQGFEVRPAPSWNGYEVEVDGIGFYGTISSVSLAVNGETIECDPLYSDGLLGTISSDDYGSIYSDVSSMMLGTISSLDVSAMNITQFSVTAPDYTVTSIDQYIPDISESFMPYLRLAIMKIASDSNAETKSVNGSRYYSARCLEGAALIGAMGDESKD